MSYLLNSVKRSQFKLYQKLNLPKYPYGVAEILLATPSLLNIMNATQLILWAIKASIFLTVFALGLDAIPKDATYLFRNPGRLLRSLLSIYIIMPLVALVIVSAFNLHPAVEIALVVLSVSPIPPLLPKKELKAGGEESFTIGLLVAMAVLAIVFVPLAIHLFENAFQRSLQITPAAVAQLVLTSVLLPLAIGIAIRYWLPAFAERIVKPVSLIATVLLVVGILPVLFVALPTVVSLIGNGTILIIVVFTLIGLSAGHFLGGPDLRDRTVLALSTASRHPGVAVAIAHTNFPEEKLALAAILLYALVNAVVTIPYVKRQQADVVGI